MTKSALSALILSLCLSAAPFAASASTLDLKLVDASGRPVSDAVVTVVPASGVPRGPISFPWGTVMTQKNIAFNPHVLIVPVGATVQFPNKDKVRHHVYSFSKPARFEMKLFGQDETRSYTFRTAGAVALGCNIHDSMSGFIKVVDTPFAGLSSDSGSVRINGLPAGGMTVTIWHPLMRAKDNEMVTQLPLPATGTVSRSFTLTLRAAG